MKRLLKEPLLHFLLLGAGIFIAFNLMPKSGWSGEPGKIVITQGQLASMMESFTRTRQRPPTREEWEGLIRERVREEVYYREALALGLDKDDTIIRRRLRQKTVSHSITLTADRAEAYAAYTLMFAAESVQEARVAMLEAVTARLAADEAIA